MTRGKALIECLLHFQCFQICYVYICIIYIFYICNAFTHTHTYKYTVACCVSSMQYGYLFLLSLHSWEKQPIWKELVLLQIEYMNFCWWQGSSELFSTYLSSVDLSAGCLPSKLCCSSFTISSLIQVVYCPIIGIELMSFKGLSGCL